MESVAERKISVPKAQRIFYIMKHIKKPFPFLLLKSCRQIISALVSLINESIARRGFPAVSVLNCVFTKSEAFQESNLKSPFFSVVKLLKGWKAITAKMFL